MDIRASGRPCRLSVIIVNYNSEALLQRCLANLSSVLAPESEVIVVDNGSSDGSVEWLRDRCPFLVQTVYLPTNVGFAAGCNEGIVRSRGKYVLLLNTDAFPKPDALDVLMDYLDQHIEVGVVGPQLLYPDGRWQFSTAPVLSVTTAMFSALGITTIQHLVARVSWSLLKRFWRPRPVGVVAGASMLIRHSMIDIIGMLDSSFFFFAEDVEFCYRAQSCGWKVMFIPQSQVLHLRGGSSFLKTPIRTMELQRAAEHDFIVKTYGEAAWDKYSFWIRLGLYWRAAAARTMGIEGRYDTYRAALKIYSGAS